MKALPDIASNEALQDVHEVHLGYEAVLAPVGNVEEEAYLGRPRVDVRIICAVSDARLKEFDLLPYS